MKPAARSACLLFAFATPSLAFAQSGSRVIPPVAQHFGPLAVVAFNEESPDPVTLRDDLLAGDRSRRMRALRAMGVESNPELQALWTAFLQAHVGESDSKGVMQFISGGMVESNFGDPGSKQYVLNAGFDEGTEHPLELRGVFERLNGQWHHTATIACRCSMYDTTEPLRDPARPNQLQEWAISLPRRVIGTANESRTSEIRFRMRDGRLWRLIQFESSSETCPNDTPSSAHCRFLRSFLQRATLLGEKGNQVPGFVVIT
ncbi:MAG TPA: hypothetical protein VGR47_01225 [Terracidiphilus sp.]|nr:hypothetical protein [Terracidiphilus sp.]